MKIDKIYVSCCKADFYLTRICIASIRYWNTSIPVFLLKDHSLGNFDTSELEKAFQVSIVPTRFKQMGAYGKIFPLIEENGSRLFVIDSDIVWIRNIIPELETFSEDIILQGYSPDDTEKEISKWYFNLPNLHKHYSQYQYPGFLFNTGQFVVSTSAFSKKDFDDTIHWQEKVTPVFDNTFLCEDQGVLNYTIAKKISSNTITCCKHILFIWGYDTAINEIDIEQKKIPAHFPSLIHWYGIKTGLIAGLPGNKILSFYENFYYSRINNGRIKMIVERSIRTVKHPVSYLKTIMKKIYKPL